MTIENLEARIGKLEKKVKKESSDKLFGKYHELGLLLVGFIVTTILGGAITYYYQSVQMENQLTMASKLEEKKQKINFYEGFSHQVNQRIFSPFRVYNAIIEHRDKEEIQKRWDEYINVVLKDWGENQMNFDIKMDFYFEPTTKLFYDNTVFPRLRLYHKAIYRLDSFYRSQSTDSLYYNQLIKDFNVHKDSINSNVKLMNKLVYQEMIK